MGCADVWRMLALFVKALIFSKHCTICLQSFPSWARSARYTCQHWTCEACLHLYIRHEVGCQKTSLKDGLPCPALCRSEKGSYVSDSEVFRRLDWSSATDANLLAIYAARRGLRGALPPSLDNQLKYCLTEEDRQFLRVARALGWRLCPHCKAVIEKIDGCNSVRCRCGHGFDYSRAAIPEISAARSIL